MATDPYAYTQAQANSMFAPQRAASNQSLKASLADKGLMGSTGAIGAQQQNDQAWQAKINEWADARFQANRNFGFQQNQANAQNAMRMWEMIQANELARKQLSNQYTFQPTTQAPIFADIFKQRFLAPTSSSGPIGDPVIDKTRGDVLPSTKVNFDTDAAVTERRVAADADANRKLQEQGLALQRAQMEFEQKAYGDSQAKESAGDDPWSIITKTALGNRQLGSPEEGQVFPTDLLNSWKSDPTIGVDVLGMAKAGDPKALAVIKILYPQSWRMVLQDAPYVAKANHEPTSLASPGGDPKNYMALGTDDRLFGLPIKGVTEGYEDKPGFLQWLAKKVFDPNY